MYFLIVNLKSSWRAIALAVSDFWIPAICHCNPFFTLLVKTDSLFASWKPGVYIPIKKHILLYAPLDKICNNVYSVF